MKDTVKGWISLLIIIFFIAVIVGSCSGNGHAPGYGNTSKCTICGKTATHHGGHYGYCDKH